jgi:hypothetical protein
MMCWKLQLNILVAVDLQGLHMSEEIKHMRECYDDDDNKKQKHENFEISFKVCYRSLGPVKLMVIHFATTD